MTATQSNKAPVKAGLFDRLKSGPVICAEGYLFELERRGYLQAGAFVPEAVVENPEWSSGCMRISCMPAATSWKPSPITLIARSSG